MRLFWWQQLPLLMLIQILESSITNHKIYAAEALPLYKKSPVGSHRQFVKWIERYPCLRLRASANCNGLNDADVFSSNSPNQLQETLHGSRNRRIAASVGVDSPIPTLTPAASSDVKKPRKHIVAAIVGGIGASLLVVVIVVLVYLCLMRIKNLIRRTSETASSVPSPRAELERGDTSPYAGAVSPHDTQNLRQLTVPELRHATSDFSQSNIIGEGVFGLAYKGLLQDGSIVVVKRRLHNPTQHFVYEVKQIARVHHKHLVKLVGYCEDSRQQLLVYDFMSNGNVGTHLYDAEGLPIGKLNMRQRLSIASGAARGLEHLHSLVPPLVHMHFRTSNVLLDENFTAKVSDYGLSKLVIDGERAGSSSVIDCFLDPERNSSKNYSTRSDVYSFGVFLLELVSGCEAHGRNQQNLVAQVKGSSNPFNFIDKSLGDHSMAAAEQVMKLALQCVDIFLRRPSMTNVVEELQRIQEREIGRGQPDFGEDIGEVTLGSELFK